MSTHLNEAEIAAFHRRGYHTPSRALSVEEAVAMRRKLESISAEFGTEDKAIPLTDLHLVYRWAWDTVHDPRIVDPVSDLLGPNVLLWSLNWFIKEPLDKTFVTYHQDATYWGLEPHDVVTAWVALSDAGPTTGPMKFIPGSHRGPVQDHIDTFEEQNLLSRGQAIDHNIPETDAILAPLEVGEMSLHHVRLIHGSEPNHTHDRRIGMVLRYCATHVTQTKLRDTAVLVRGVDSYDHFDLLPQPETDAGDEELRRQKDALGRTHRALHSKDYE
ncbi:MAG: phytanoyl-CoA dioxygenase family protein [Pseudomonadales bacterium]|nr:phytanoyl-CoA dioxygenase family protein [Pseudomonadales bacterium]